MIVRGYILRDLLTGQNLVDVYRILHDVHGDDDEDVFAEHLEQMRPFICDLADAHNPNFSGKSSMRGKYLSSAVFDVLDHYNGNMLSLEMYVNKELNKLRRTTRQYEEYEDDSYY